MFESNQRNCQTSVVVCDNFVVYQQYWITTFIHKCRISMNRKDKTWKSDNKNTNWIAPSNCVCVVVAIKLKTSTTWTTILHGMRHDTNTVSSPRNAIPQLNNKNTARRKYVKTKDGNEIARSWFENGSVRPYKQHHLLTRTCTEKHLKCAQADNCAKLLGQTLRWDWLRKWSKQNIQTPSILLYTQSK
jgi:hypothetical protein